MTGPTRPADETPSVPPEGGVAARRVAPGAETASSAPAEPITAGRNEPGRGTAAGSDREPPSEAIGRAIDAVLFRSDEGPVGPDLGTADHSWDPNRGHLLPPAPDRPGEPHRLVVLDRGTPQAAEWAAERLVAGGLVAFPTDTVYGLGASLAEPDALRRVFAIKDRPANRVLPVLLASVDDLALVTGERAIAPRLHDLLDRHWPGPLTVAVPARAGLPPEVVAPDGTVGVRVPNHPLALRLLEAAGGAIAATSANRSGQPPLGTAAEVAAALGDDLDLLLDGGATPGLLPSTVVAVADGALVILREGAIPAAELLEGWGSAPGEPGDA
jgi:L-threonylcarbamoyladenylate synthase